MVWVVAGAGVVAVLSALWLAVKPHVAALATTIIAMGLTLALGWFGTVRGLKASFRDQAEAETPPQRTAILSESLSRAYTSTAVSIGMFAVWVAPFLIGVVRYVRGNRRSAVAAP